MNKEGVGEWAMETKNIIYCKALITRNKRLETGIVALSDKLPASVMKDSMKQYFDKLLPNLPFIIIVWTIGFYSLRQSVKQFNLDSPQDIHLMHLVFLGIGFFFLLLPFVKTIKIGKYFELERNIKETKEEIRDFKREINQSVQLLSTSVSASIGNLNNQVTINLPAASEMKAEIKKLKNQVNKADQKEIKDELLLDEDDDVIMALARTRIKLESLLRKILDKRRSIETSSNTNIKFLGLKSLWMEYINQNPEAENLYSSFKYVNAVCNAAIHGQKVSLGQAKEALHLGALLIATLNEKVGD